MAEIHSASEDIEIEASFENPDVVSLDINRLVSSIGGKLRSLGRLGPPLSTECCIYMVPEKIRSLNEAAYTPQVVSIGPLHHGKVTLEEMEKHKLRYLDEFLKNEFVTSDKNSASLENFVHAIKMWESEIRSCYAMTFDYLNSDEFVQMILVDVGFIIELFLRDYLARFDENDHLFFKPSLAYVNQDLYLLENQLPFFVFEKLYNLAFPSRPNYIPSFIDLACYYFSDYNQQNRYIRQEVKHFTDLLRILQLPHSHRPEFHKEPKLNDKSIQQRLKHFTDLLISFLPHCCKSDDLQSAIEVPDVTDEVKKKVEIDLIYRATELHDAGVKFELSSSKCLFDIKFSGGVLTIPCLKVYDGTEALIQNLMALEQCRYPREAYICNYVLLMITLSTPPKTWIYLLKRKSLLIG